MESNSTAHLPILRKENPPETKKYTQTIRRLQKEFSLQFKNLLKNETDFYIFSSPFNRDTEKITEKFQIEIINQTTK